MDTDHAAVERMLEVAEQCTRCRCGCCKDECPMYSEMLEETISPKGRNQVVRAIASGDLKPDERAMRIAYSCLLCRRDEQTCQAQLKNAEATETFRAYLLEMGVRPLAEHEVLVKSLENYGNPWQESRVGRKRWAKDFESYRAAPGKMDILFFVGCTYALDRSLREGPMALANIMAKAGERFGLLLENEVCCGSTAKRLGQIGLFEKLRAQNEKIIRSTGARRVVTSCAGCYKTLSQDYPGLSSEVRVVHSSEYLAGLVRSGKLSISPGRAKVTYHDPCHLGRHSGIYDDPRDVLAAIPGLQLVEMKASRELSRCCGGGAGVKTAYPAVAQRVAERRLKEAEATGADVLVTACPFCVQTLRAAGEASGSRIAISELSVFLDGHTR